MATPFVIAMSQWLMAESRSYLNTEFLSAFQASKLQGGLCYIGVAPRAELSPAFQALGNGNAVRHRNVSMVNG
jgi:hypothetical protein